MIDDTFAYSRIGMALISAQRVEFMACELVDHLIEFDKDIYEITTSIFLDSSPASQKLRK